MKHNPDFAKYLSDFLMKYLPGTLNVSKDTVASYRDTFKLFLLFMQEEKKIYPNKIYLEKIIYQTVIDFLDWIEKNRCCSIATRNQRLAGIHSFLKYVQMESPENLYEIQRILKIPSKKAPKANIQFMTLAEMEILLAQPDISIRNGRRDLTLLALMYDSAARVQELIDLTIKSVRLEDPAVVILHGKGNKTRTVPIMKNTVLLLRGYLKEQNFTHNIIDNESPLFFNQQKQKLTRKGVSHILNKYVCFAKENSAFTRHEKITCHVLRHSRAAHMIQAEIPLIYIRDFLGHSSVQSTEIYARLNNDIKRKAIESAYIDLNTPEYPSWDDDANLIDWLTNLCK